MKMWYEGADKYLSHPLCSLTADSSKVSMRNTLRDFQRSYPDLEIHTVEPRHVEEWAGNKRLGGTSDAVVKKYVQRLRSFFEWCVLAGHISSSPVGPVEKLLRLRPQRVREHHWLNEPEVQRIFDGLEILTSQDMRDAIILRLGFNLGLRNNEIRTLPMSALGDLGRSQMTLVGKGGRLAQVYVPPKTVELLQAWRETYEKPKPSDPVVIAFRNLRRDWRTEERLVVPQWGTGIRQQMVGRIVAQRTAAVGLKLAPHDMRRTFAGIMKERHEGDVVAVSRAMRHASIATTQTYLEHRPDSAFQAVRAAGIDF